MNTHPSKILARSPVFRAAVAAALLGMAPLGEARASIAYGSINNFDTVNDTGHVCHGFEIELDDIHSTDITYTYDYNHYGAPKITEDNSVAAHPKVFVSYQSAKNSDGTWAAFTAVPSAPIAPTMGHQFTDPSVNFGGEHFGLGYRTNPSNIVYNWLIDNGSGALVHGGTVSITTPVFVYAPAAAGAPAQFQAAIVPPPPPAPPVVVYEFGHPSWVKEIRTTTHNNNKVELRDLVSDDPVNPPAKNWKNGEPDEVEMEWQLMQTDLGKANGGANAELQGKPEDLNKGDEVVTRRYEFYEYTGPIDPETHEALAGSVDQDGIHGTGTNAAVVVVGKYLGAQMSAANAVAPVALIDHLPDGSVGEKYTDRTVVIAGSEPFVATSSGVLPVGVSFDPVNGVISGTPTESGAFSFTVNATAGSDPQVTKIYALSIAQAGALLPPHSAIGTAVSPADAGTTTGNGVYDNGTDITVTASPKAGYVFANWTDNGVSVSESPSYTFTTDVNRALTANFTIAYALTINAAGGTVTKQPDQASYTAGTVVTLTPTPDAGHRFDGWSGDASGTANPLQVTMSGNKTVTAAFPSMNTHTVTPGAGANGTVSPQAAQIVNDGHSIDFTATPALNGYGVDQWAVNGVNVQAGGTKFSLTNVTADATVTVKFQKAPPVLLAFTPGPWTPGATVKDVVKAANNPTSFAVNGLPSGVVLNSATGQLSGRPSNGVSKVTTYHLSITATNVTGTCAPLKVDVDVVPLATTIVGTFDGLVDRDAGLGGGLGGTCHIVTTLAGGYTGKLVLGAASYLLSGQLTTAVGADATATVAIARTKQPSLTVAIRLKHSTGELTGSVTDGLVHTPVNIAGWRASVPPAKVATTYTTGLELDPDLAGTDTTASNVGYPQGEGFGTLAISAKGAVTWSGKLADGSVVTATTTVGPNGDVPLHFLLYSGTGAAHGWVTASADSNSAPTNDGQSLLDGTVDWNKAGTTAATRNYKDGFPLHSLNVMGGQYVKPGTGHYVIGLAANGGGNNAKFTFGEGGLYGPASAVVGTVVSPSDLNKSFRIGPTTSAITLPKAAVNPAALSLSLSGTTGSFSGSFVLKGDPDPTKPTSKLSRSVSYYGLLVSRLGVQRGVGFFLLAELPSAGLPKTTLTSSPQLSGRVLIDAGP